MGWRRFADPGGPEAGFTGNAHWVRARSPQDVVAGLTPLGCAGTAGGVRFPRPVHALEASYASAAPDGATAIALALDFGSPALAGIFMARQSDVVTRCPDAAAASLVITPRTVSAPLVVDDRLDSTAESVVWTEVVLRVGARVELLSVSRAPGAPAPDTTRLVAAMRAALG